MTFTPPSIPAAVPEHAEAVARQSYAGLLWSKQFYHYVVRGLARRRSRPAAADPRRKQGRNREWPHLYNRDVISMPDKWEYPWFAAWDLAFHMIPMARIDPEFAKHQLVLFLREWYMHPNGQLPAYEFAFGDVNPPVHAWAAWRVYKMTGTRGERDRAFWKACFRNCCSTSPGGLTARTLRATTSLRAAFWAWTTSGCSTVRSPLPTGGFLQQADGTAWMALLLR